MAREQQRESATSNGMTGGNGGTETGYRPETRQSRQGNGGSRALEHTGRRGALQATRGWPGLLGGGIPASPWELVRRMSEEMSQLFETLGGTGAGPSGLDRRQTAGEPPLLIPRTEIIQQPDALLVRVEMPGMAADEIDVTVEDGVLTIAGERRQEDREEGDGFVRSELVYGTFFRSIPLPEGADEDNILAVVRNGVLEIIIPMSTQEQGRRVNVQAGEGAESTRGELGRGGGSSSSGGTGASGAGGSSSGGTSGTSGSSTSGSATSGSSAGGAGSSRGE